MGRRHRTVGYRTSGRERGAVVLVTATALVGLLTLAALVVDIGVAKWQRREAQNSVDAAALAGSLKIRELELLASTGSIQQRNSARVCLNGDQEVGSAPCRKAGGDPRVVAADTVDRNRFDPDQTVVDWPPVGGEHDGDRRCVQVSAAGSSTTAFAGVIGVDAIDLSAEAVSCTGDLNPDESGPVPALLALGECGFESLDISGSANTFVGGVETNSGGKVGGSGNTFYDPTAAAGSPGALDDPANRVLSTDWSGSDQGGTVEFKASDNSYPDGSPGTLATPNPDPLDGLIRMADFTPAADGGSGYWDHDPNFYDLDRLFPGTDTIDSGTLADGGLYDAATGELRAGIYYSTKKIDFSAELNGVTPGGLQADGTTSPVGVTIVHRDTDTSSEQGILFSGSNGTSGQVAVESYVGGVLVFSDESLGPCATNNVVSVSGQNHRFGGIVYAPRGRVELSGSDTHLEPGSIVAQQIKINGSNSTVNALDLDANTVPWNRVISRLVS